MILDFVSAGAKLRSTANAISEKAVSTMDEARRQCRDAEQATRTQLTELDSLRGNLSEELVGVLPLYGMIGLNNPGGAVEDDTTRLREVVFDATSLPALPSASSWLFCGALSGSAIGAASVFAASLAGPLTWIVGVVSGGFVATALAGMIQGRKAIAAACKQQQAAQQWQERAAAYALQLDRIRRGATLSMQLTEGRARLLRSRQDELQKIALDTTNAAKLLKDVLNTALLDEEGALLDDIIQELHGQKERIVGFAGQIALEA